ncbi:AAA family ATPase [Acidithiobacillus ferrivorans]|nr:AAA family ATPase [Acidithiobacillus ferrivorans]
MPPNVLALGLQPAGPQRIAGPVLVVIAGPNGSGKSELVRQLVRLDYFGAAGCVNPDDIAAQMPGGWHNPDNFLPAAQKAEAIRQDYLARRQSLVFETVFSSPGKVDFVRDAATSGYFVHFLYICTDDPKIQAARVCARVMQGGHSVPIEKIISRYFKSLDLAAQVLPYVSLAHFFDNTPELTAPRLVVEAIPAQQSGSTYGVQPAWMTGILDQMCQLGWASGQSGTLSPEPSEPQDWIKAADSKPRGADITGKAK